MVIRASESTVATSKWPKGPGTTFVIPRRANVSQNFIHPCVAVIARRQFPARDLRTPPAPGAWRELAIIGESRRSTRPRVNTLCPRSEVDVSHAWGKIARVEGNLEPASGKTAGQRTVNSERCGRSLFSFFFGGAGTRGRV